MPAAPLPLPLAPPPASAAADADAPCAHCGLPVTEAGARFCCSGCEAVYELLHREHLDRYYELQGADGCPVPARPQPGAARAWLEPLLAELRRAPGIIMVRLDVQGIHCAACVWLIEELFRRRAGGLRADVNPALGTLAIHAGADFDLAGFVTDVERFGYQLGPALKAPARASSDLLIRLGVCAALSMNAMIFAISIYVGLDAGPLYRLFQGLVFALATLAVAVGGSVFIRSAWYALRRGVLHMDLPIALGILLAYGSSTAAYLAGRGHGVYFDTVCVFITLMLLGRFLQERVLERNRRALLASDGVDGLLTRRRDGGRVELVRCTTLVAGDELVIAPGDLIPVDAELLDEGAACSLDWINGESAPRAFACGDVLPAGAFNAGRRPLAARATTAFASSALVDLLRTTHTRPADAARATPWWRRFARIYVTSVLTVGAATLTGWLLVTHDPARALEVTAAVLIVTCPCAFGIATPLGYELVQAGLRRAGLFVRSAGFLDRATDVHRVVFDKTGTLTTGTLRLTDVAPLAALSAAEREALYNLAARSTHPKSAAIVRALGDGFFDPGLPTDEQPGDGIELWRDGHIYRLGRPAWVAPALKIPGDLAFAVDGRLLCTLYTEEQIRPDAAAEIARLRALGHDVWILSGDEPQKVAALAARLGVPDDHAVGGHDPRAKAAWLSAHDIDDTLMIGDGINDGLAVERAFCSGTPAVDRPFMPARTDFYFVTPGLRPVRLALTAAAALAGVTRRNLAIAIAYNLVTVSLSVAGLMSPLLCAVVMPVSSLTVVLSTSHSLSRRSPLWKS